MRLAPQPRSTASRLAPNLQQGGEKGSLNYSRMCGTISANDAFFAEGKRGTNRNATV
jgi:hypothetical protein